MLYTVTKGPVEDVFIICPVSLSYTRFLKSASENLPFKVLQQKSLKKTQMYTKDTIVHLACDKRAGGSVHCCQ